MNRKFRSLIRVLLPQFLRRNIKDVYEVLIRFAPGKHKGLVKYNLGKTQVYPNGNNLLVTLTEATKLKLSSLEITKDTPVASIGSCFAEEFAYFMEKNGYNYIRTEGDKLTASANWGRVYTIPNLLQIVRYSSEDSYPVIVENCSKGWFDPLRESSNPFHLNKCDAESEVILHRKASFDALTKCKVLIITLGQNEKWVDNKNSKVWVRIPPGDIMKSRGQDFSVEETGYQENLNKLNEIIFILKNINPSINILFTVSPVAAYATFIDSDVIANSFANKCMLRTVVNEVVRADPQRLFYFPSFEITLCDNPRSFRADNRHVKYATVDRIFSLFMKATS